MPSTFVIAQGGGPTAVINQTLVGAVLEAGSVHPGARSWVRGMACAAFAMANMSISPPSPRRNCAVRQHAERGAGLHPRQARCGLLRRHPRRFEKGRCRRLHLYRRQRHGGHAAELLTNAAKGSMAFVHAPKTIDNDLVENDHTPGFISAG